MVLSKRRVNGMPKFIRFLLNLDLKAGRMIDVCMPCIDHQNLTLIVLYVDDLRITFR